MWWSLFLHCSLSSHSSMHLNIHHSWRSLLGRSRFRYFNIRSSNAVSTQELITFKDYWTTLKGDLCVSLRMSSNQFSLLKRKKRCFDVWAWGGIPFFLNAEFQFSVLAEVDRWEREPRRVERRLLLEQGLRAMLASLFPAVEQSITRCCDHEYWLVRLLNI